MKKSWKSNYVFFISLIIVSVFVIGVFYYSGFNDGYLLSPKKILKEKIDELGEQGAAEPREETIVEEPIIEEIEPISVDSIKEPPYLESLSGEPFFGMEILSVTGNSGMMTIITTGAGYILTRNGMEMWRLIDPATNTYNSRLVATLNFGEDIGPLSIDNADRRTTVINSDKVVFEFKSDSLFFVNATDSFSYSHNNLINDAPWNRGWEVDDMYRDRMWTDGYGGSLHAYVEGSPSATNTTDTTTFMMNNGDSMAHMVFPPKLFDFERLYGEDSRPFVQFVYNYNNLNRDLNRMDLLKEEGFGVFVLFHDLYYNTDGIYWTPEWLEQGYWGLDYSNPALIHEFVDLAHENGFKVTMMMITPPNYNRDNGIEVWHDQSIEVTEQWMSDIQEEYNLDGWYFDSNPYNFVPMKFIDLYSFIRWVRTNISDDGIIYHHNSRDMWSAYRGARAIFVDVYVDYTLTGEHGPEAYVDFMNDPYFRYFTNDYGMSQAIASHKNNPRFTSIFEEEKNRIIGENLNGAERSYGDAWLSHFKPAYDIRKAEYLSGEFNPDLDWPIDTVNGWFREPTNIQIIENNATSITVKWETSEPATSDLAWTSNNAWWWYSLWYDNHETVVGPDCGYYDSDLTTKHSVTVDHLIPVPSGRYEFRIRSSNKKDVPEEIIWGDVFVYSTSP